MTNVRVLSALGKHHEGFCISNEGAMRALWQAEEKHFWHRTRNRFVADRLQKLGLPPGTDLLELGCGSGCVAAFLTQQGYRVTGVDGHPALIYQAARRAPMATFLIHDLAHGVDALRDLPLSDVVGLFDVVEHLDRPVAMLEEALSLVKKGGWVVGTVPALMSLWSGVDAAAGHRLRYESKSLHELLHAVKGAELVEVVPFNRVLVPLLWLQRRWLGRSPPPELSERNLQVPVAPLNLLLHRLVQGEQRLAPYLDRMPIAGASLWFALQKRE